MAQAELVRTREEGIGELDPAFGNWLAGFADGEGSFVIITHNPHAFSCRFAISLRDDDADILREIRARTGIGSRYHRKPHVDSLRRNCRAQLAWLVQTKADCLRLVEIFDEFPLRAKKRRDFEVWREAVFEWQKMRYGHRNDWSRMSELKDQLVAGRRYPE